MREMDTGGALRQVLGADRSAQRVPVAQRLITCVHSVGSVVPCMGEDKGSHLRRAMFCRRKTVEPLIWAVHSLLNHQSSAQGLRSGPMKRSKFCSSYIRGIQLPNRLTRSTQRPQ
jgi:hypothetical protein